MSSSVWSSVVSSRPTMASFFWELRSRYNKLAGMATRLVAKLKELPADDPFRIKVTDQMLEKLYLLGVIPTRQSMDKVWEMQPHHPCVPVCLCHCGCLCGLRFPVVGQVEHLSASAFCRRRLPVVMVRLHMCETLKEAVTFIEQGHVRVGPEVVTDPAFLVTRSLQDFVTWVDSSKIKRTVMTYNDAVDDFELQGN